MSTKEIQIALMEIELLSSVLWSKIFRIKVPSLFVLWRQRFYLKILILRLFETLLYST